MSRRSRITATVVAAITVISLAPLAAASAPSAQGWWYAPRISGLPVAAPTPASVPEDGLFVELGPTGANAMAAVRGTVAAGTPEVQLLFTVVDSSGTPVIGACPTTDDWAPAQGGNWDQKPECDGDDSVAAEFSEDGSVMAVDITQFVDGDAFDVLLIPGVASGGASFSVSLAKTDDGTVQATAPTTTTTTTTGSAPTTSPPTTRATPPTTAFVPRPSSTPTTAFRPAPSLTPAPEPDDTLEIPPIADEIASPPVARPVVNNPGGSATDNGRLLGLALAVAVAAAYVVLRGKTGPQPAPIIQVGAARETPPPAPEPTLAADAPVSGIGRFARPRIGTPPPLH